MPFSDEDKALTRIPVQKIRFAKDCDGIFEDKQQKGRSGHFSEKDSGKHEAPTTGMRVADQSMHVLKRT